MKHYVNRTAWVFFAISLMVVGYHLMKLANSKSRYDQLSIQYAALKAEVENQMSWETYLPKLGKSIFDGATFGTFAEEGIFTEYNKMDRWQADVVKRDAAIREEINQCVSSYNAGLATRNIFSVIGIVALLVGIFTKEPRKIVVAT
jgi:hypothetical protein